MYVHAKMHCGFPPPILSLDSPRPPSDTLDRRAGQQTEPDSEVCLAIDNQKSLPPVEFYTFLFLNAIGTFISLKMHLSL